jgi:hypothetical protein
MRVMKRSTRIRTAIITKATRRMIHQDHAPFSFRVFHVGVWSDARPTAFVLIAFVPGALFLDVGQTARLISA